MRAIQITGYGGPTAVELAEIPVPPVSAGQLLIEVHAAGVSFPQVLQSQGLYQSQPPLPFVPGVELAGVVVDAPGGSALTAGDRVAASCRTGAFAEYAVVDEQSVFPLPDAASFEQGAAFPLNYLTAHFALITRGRLAPGESVLVHGAAGGVGTAAIQVAKAFGAGTVIAVVSTEEKGAIAIDAGADDFVLSEGFKDAVAGLTGGAGVDVVVDPVGGDRFTDSLRSLAVGGRLLVIGFTGGEIPTVKVNRLLLNNIEVVGVGWGAYLARRPEYVAQQWAELRPHLASGTIRPIIGASFPLERAADALTAIDERRATGKVVLTLR